MTDELPTVRSTLTGCTLATPSLTTKTKVPVWLTCTAADGTTTALLARSVSSVVTSVPGQSISFAFGMVARIMAMPVAGSTVFSIMVTWPVARLSEPGDDRVDGRGLVGERLADIGQALLRHREGDVDRRHLVDGRHWRGVGLAHEIADLDGGGADAAGDRRGDGAIAELDLEIVEQALIGLDRRAINFGLGLGVVEIDGRRRRLGDQIGIAGDVAHGAVELGLVAGDGAFGLRDLGLDGAAIEREQQVALLDLLAVAEMHADDVGVDARLDGDAGDRASPCRARRGAPEPACARAVATSTGTTRLPAACERAAAPSPDASRRTTTTMPIRASAATPMSHFRLIMGNSCLGLRPPAGPCLALPLRQPLP